MTKRHQQILDVYHRIEETELNISTERLLAMVEDETGADASEVIEALLEEEEER